MTLSGQRPSERVNQPRRDDIVSANARIAGEAVVVQRVDFVIHPGGHIFVEVPGRADVHVFQDIFIAIAAFQIFTP